MVELKVGDEVELQDVKTGETNGKEWYMFLVKATQGYDRIAVWVTNVDAVRGYHSHRVRIKEITSVRNTQRQYNGKWLQQVSINAVVEEVISIIGDTSDMTVVDDDELPFM